MGACTSMTDEAVSHLHGLNLDDSSTSQLCDIVADRLQHITTICRQMLSASFELNRIEDNRQLLLQAIQHLNNILYDIHQVHINAPQ